MKDYQTLYKAAKKTIAELEERLGQQAIELALMGHASLEIRKEDTEQLADFKTTNKALIEFAEKVAETKSKYAGEARELLGR